MRISWFAALAAMLAVVAGGCGASAEPAARAAAAPVPRIELPGSVSTLRPPGWQLTRPPITALTYPVERLLLTSYRAHGGGNCGPDRAERELPADGALVYLFEYRPKAGRVWAHLKRADYPPRPVHVALKRSDLANYECWRVPSYAIRFRAADRPFQLHIAFGARASAARRAQVLRIVDGLRFAALRPLPPKPVAVSASQLERALRTNPGNAATAASCRAATRADRGDARSFAKTRRLFICEIALHDEPAETFDVQLLADGCFVAERRRPGEADYGCVR